MNHTALPDPDVCPECKMRRPRGKIQPHAEDCSYAKQSEAERLIPEATAAGSWIENPPQQAEQSGPDVCAEAEQPDSATCPLCNGPLSILGESVSPDERFQECLHCRTEAHESTWTELREAVHKARLWERFHHFGQEDIWYWQGEGTDNLESLTCPVIIRADELHDIAAIAERAELLANMSAGGIVEYINIKWGESIVGRALYYIIHGPEKEG